MKIFSIIAITCLLATQAFGEDIFTDEELSNVLNNNNEGIIYLWSPYMPLSIIGREEIIEVAEKLNLSLTLVVDPLATHTQTVDPLMKSRTLMEHGVLDHYPAVTLYSEGRLVENVIIHGYEPKKTLSKLIKSYLNRNKK